MYSRSYLKYISVTVTRVRTLPLSCGGISRLNAGSDGRCVCSSILTQMTRNQRRLEGEWESERERALVSKPRPRFDCEASRETLGCQLSVSNWARVPAALSTCCWTHWGKQYHLKTSPEHGKDATGHRLSYYLFQLKPTAVSNQESLSQNHNSVFNNTASWTFPQHHVHPK